MINARHWGISTALFGLLALAAACGSDDSGGGGVDAGKDGSATGGCGGCGGSLTGGSSGTGATGGSAGSGATGGTGATGGSAGSGGGTGGTAGASGGAAGAGGGSAGSGGGSGGAMGDVGIVCGTTFCSLPGNFCCDHPNQAPECVANGGTCTFGVEVACDGPEDCASGEVCCATLFTQGQNASYVSTMCATTCTGKDRRVVCGATGTCPTGQTCGTSDLLPPYNDCK
jgi:hypothetical protein